MHLKTTAFFLKSMYVTVLSAKWLSQQQHLFPVIDTGGLVRALEQVSLL